MAENSFQSFITLFIGIPALLAEADIFVQKIYQ